MKTIKRVLVVIVLVAVVLAVGYLCYTGSRLADASREESKQRDGYIAVLLCDGNNGRTYQFSG